MISFYYTKPLQGNAYTKFSRKFAPGFSIDINKGGFDLPFGVKKPDMDGFVHELQVFENCQYLATKNSHLSQKIIKIILLTNVCVNPTLQDSFD